MEARGGKTIITALKEINLLNDQAFKALFRSIEAREIVSYFLSKLTGIEKEVFLNAEYQAGELPKKVLTEKGKQSAVIIKIEKDNKIILEMNQYKTVNTFEKNTSYAFSVASETVFSNSKKYPKIILINIDNFNSFQTKEPILNFKIRDEYGHIETEMYHSIHLILENVVNYKYNVDKEIKKMVELLTSKTVEEMKEKFEGDEKYMAAIRRVEELSTDPNFVGYYDIEEARKWELEDMRETGFIEGMEKGVEKGIEQNKIETAKSMLKDGVPIENVSKYTNLKIESLESLTTQ